MRVKDDGGPKIGKYFAKDSDNDSCRDIFMKLRSKLFYYTIFQKKKKSCTNTPISNNTKSFNNDRKSSGQSREEAVQHLCVQRGDFYVLFLVIKLNKSKEINKFN